MIRHRRRTADLPLAILVGVATALAAGLALFVARYSAAADPFVACETWATTALARLSSIGLLLPTAVLASAGVAAALALTHQLVATRRMLRRVLVHRVPPPPAVAAAAAQAGLDVAARLDVVDDARAFTFCHGLVRPRICLTSGLASLLAADELAAVLRHERHHVRFHDPLKILVGRTIASGLFFLPLAGLLRNGYLAGKELCADADADRADGALARALVKLLGAARPSWPAGVLAIGAFSPTEARLQQLIEPDRVPRTLPAAMDWIASAALVAGLFGFSFGAAAARSTAPIEAACAPALAFAPAGGVPALLP